jgi:hypothetical protein
MQGSGVDAMTDLSGRGQWASRALLREVAVWSIPVAIVVAAVGALVTRDWRFVVSCGIGSAADILTMLPVAGIEPPEGASALHEMKRAAALFGGRLLLKSVLLIAAFALPWLLDPWGMVAGVLVYDTTLLTAGAAATALRTFRA